MPQQRKLAKKYLEVGLKGQILIKRTLRDYFGTTDLKMQKITRTETYYSLKIQSPLHPTIPFI